MRGSEFYSEEDIEGGETKADAWERLWDALFARPVRFVLFVEPDIVLALQTCSKTAHSFAYTIEHGFPSWVVWIGLGLRGIGGMEQDIFELPYTEAGAGGMPCWVSECRRVVFHHYGYKEGGAVGVAAGSASREVIQNAGLGGGRRLMSGWVGEVGGEERIIIEGQRKRKEEAMIFRQYQLDAKLLVFTVSLFLFLL
jgi:hypothetical protein